MITNSKIHHLRLASFWREMACLFLEHLSYRWEGRLLLHLFKSPSIYTIITVTYKVVPVDITTFYILYFKRNVAIFLSMAMTEGLNNDTNYWVDSGWKFRRTKRSSKKSNTYSIQTVGESSSLPLLTFR